MFSQGSTTSIGTRLVQFVVAVLLIVLVGGALWLGFGDVQPQRETVERAIER